MWVRAEWYAGLPGAHDVPPPRPHRQDIPPGEAGHLNVSYMELVTYRGVLRNQVLGRGTFGIWGGGQIRDL